MKDYQIIEYTSEFHERAQLVLDELEDYIISIDEDHLDIRSEAYHEQMLDHDLLITAALFHDVGKIRELSLFPQNDYTDEGQLIGHIIIGTQMIHDAIAKIDGFPTVLANELEHCILSHHGELEYGSPKKPAIAEALALSLADLTDARMETMRELIEDPSSKSEWIGYNRLMETNIRRTQINDQ